MQKPFLFSIVFSCMVLSASASDEKPKQGKSPASLFPNAPPPESMVFYPKESAYRHWQYLSMDRGGFFKPRVAYSINGPFYLYNGMDYPFMNSRRGEFMPNVLGFQSFFTPGDETIEPPLSKGN